jgi:hypothetical protein
MLENSFVSWQRSLDNEQDRCPEMEEAQMRILGLLLGRKILDCQRNSYEPNQTDIRQDSK